MGMSDPLNGDLITHRLRYICERRPKTVILEEVVFRGKDKEILAAVLEILESAGYAAALKVLNTRALGVPQNRPRNEHYNYIRIHGTGVAV